MMRDRLTNWLTRRRDRERDLDRELRAHVDLEAEDLQEAGLPADEARRAAGRVLGNVAVIKEDVREAWGFPAIERLLLDVQYSLRLLRRTPAFTFGAALSLSLAIGVNVAVFTLLDAVLLKPIPVSDPASLVRLSFYAPDGRGPDYIFSYPDFRALREQTRSLSGLIAASSLTRVDVGRGADATQAYAKIVSANYFELLGVHAAAGRVFDAADENRQSAVISDGYWQRAFNRSPSALGSEIVVGGLPFTIVGLAPPAFFGDTIGESPDFWTTVALQTTERRTQRYITWARLLGRLAPEVTLDAARAELEPLGGRIGIEGRIDVEHAADGVPGLGQRVATPLRALMAFVGLVWLIACTNLSSLLLTRAAARQREIATRLAIGASRLRVARQLAVESVLVALIGGALGLVLSTWASRFLLTLVAAVNRTPVVLDLTPSSSVLLFAAAISVITGLLVGVGPAFHAVRRDMSPALRGGRAIVGRERRWGLGEAAIVTQVALSLMLLACSGLFLGTLGNLRAQEFGFSGAEHVLLVEIRAQRGYRPQLPVLIPRLQEAIATIPDVTGVSMAFGGTLAGQGGVMGLEVEGYTPGSPDDQRARADWVAPGYFATAGIPLVAGRAFSMTDTASTPRVVVINETMARFYFGDGPAAGRRVRFNKNEYEIIGVAKDAKYESLRSTTPRMIYFTLLQNPSSPNNIEVRTSGSPSAAASAVRDAIRAADPQLSIGGMMTLEERVRRSLGPEYLLANLSGLLSTLTLLLAAVGVYGTLAYASARRRNEIGVRLALGASRVSVVWTMLRDLVWLLSAGMLLGAGAVFAAGRLVRTLLFGLTPTDPLTIGLAALLLLVIAIAAGAVPARRASRLDLADVLRLG